MADESDVSQIVTTFLLDTCRLPPRRSKHRFEAVLHSVNAATGHPPDDKEAEHIPLITGSVAEFYIEPMLPHVGDIDVMLYRNTHLAIPRGHPPPTQLPAEFHNYVKVYEITDSHVRGYVYLLLRYLLSKRTDNDKYEYFECDVKPCDVVTISRKEDESNMTLHGPYLLHISQREGEGSTNIHGPALLRDNSHLSQLSVDFVRCVRCLSWPSQASDWPTRHRNYGWPDSTTLDRVVSNGCDVVGMTHRRCRQHEMCCRAQWRLSFSRAEIVLINSWMPVQQITYHLLRVYVKTERLTESADNSGAATLSNYHIKTLMLWACELKPGSWWAENLNLVRICVELLQTLSVWLTDTRCPHYFVRDCNLLDNSFNVERVASKLMPVDEEHLSTWFIRHYVGQCAQLCPFYVFLFGDVSTSVKLHKAVSEIVRCRLNTSLHDMWQAVDYAEARITAAVSGRSLTVRSCVYWTNELTKIDKRFSIYFSSIVLLHVACKTGGLSRNGFNDKWTDILTTVLGHNSSQCCSVLPRCTTELNTSELVELLQQSAVEHLTTYRQLVAPDLGSVATIVTTDIEALYAYKRGDYQRCLQLSTQNVHTLLYALCRHSVSTTPEFIQLMDDDIVSLTALTLTVSPECRDKRSCSSISQLTLSLYLMTQCQLKLHHSVTSLAQTLAYVKVAQRRHPRWRTLDHLTLKLTERKVFGAPLN